MTAVTAVVRTWRVGQFTVTLSLPQSGSGIASCEWAPYMPASLTDDDAPAIQNRVERRTDRRAQQRRCHTRRMTMTEFFREKAMIDFKELAVSAAVQKELAAVKAAVATGERGALGKAFTRYAQSLRVGLGLSDQAVDLYCFGRLQQFAATGIPADAALLAGATAQLLQLLKGTQ